MNSKNFRQCYLNNRSLFVYLHKRNLYEKILKIESKKAKESTTKRQSHFFTVIGDIISK